MHSKILCTRVRYCYPDQIACIVQNRIILKPGEQLRELFSESPAQYELQKTHDSPGTRCAETLSLTVRHDSEIAAVRYMPAVFLIDFDAGQTVMGSILYPCEVETVADGRQTQLTINN